MLISVYIDPIQSFVEWATGQQVFSSDVYFLSRLPDRLGLYLGLTANSIGLGDAMAADLVTHAVARCDFDAVIAAPDR